LENKYILKKIKDKNVKQALYKGMSGYWWEGKNEGK
jgi:hypothetical protein